MSADGFNPAQVDASSASPLSNSGDAIHSSDGGSHIDETHALTIPSPNIDFGSGGGGGGGGGLGMLDLDEVEYTVGALDAQQYWIQNCVWMRRPRVKQFLQPKFCAIILVLTLTGCFLALATTLMTVPKLPDIVGAASDAPVVVANPDLHCSTDAPAQTWSPGSVLIRDPAAPSARLLVFDPSGVAGSSSAALAKLYNISVWDFVARFDGLVVTLYGPSLSTLGVADSGAGALGAPDLPQLFNSWGLLAGQWQVASAAEWYAKQTVQALVAVLIPASTSNVTNSNGTVISVTTTPASSRIEAAYGLKNSAGVPTSFYLFNNRTDVHTKDYALITQAANTTGGGGNSSTGAQRSAASSSSVPSTSRFIINIPAVSSSSSSTGSAAASATSTGSSSSSSTGSASPSSPVFPPHPSYSPLPFWRMRLFVSGSTLSVCAEKFVQPTT